MANMQEAYEKVKAPQTGTMTSVSSVSPNGGSAGNAWQDAYNAYANGARGQAVAGVYDAQTQAELGGLKAAYDQNLSTQQAAREKIAGAYQQSGNAMQAQYERNRRNLNQQAAANGINTGAGSQQQLALQNVWNRDYGNLMGQQAQAYADADRAIADLQVTYQNAIQQAQAQGDYRKMAALLDDYQQAYNQQLQQAQTLASYGDFSGYSGIYSADQIANMRNAWIASNPQMAYNMGLITAAELARMTGGTFTGSSGGSYSGYYRGSDSNESGSDGTTNTSGWSDTMKAALDAMNAMFLNGSSQAEVDAAIMAESALTDAEKQILLGYKNTGGTNSGMSTTRSGDYTGDLVWDPGKKQYVSKTTGRPVSALPTTSTGTSSTVTWPSNTSAMGAAAHANDEEDEQRRWAATHSDTSTKKAGSSSSTGR